jgi:hypothetical protein
MAPMVEDALDHVAPRGAMEERRVAAVIDEAIPRRFIPVRERPHAKSRARGGHGAIRDVGWNRHHR